MRSGRLEAFSDGVIAIIITIMVLELRIPHGSDLRTLKPLIPVLLSYALSFVIIGIYWNNHHHLLQATKTISGGVLWANLHLLFWLSLFPFGTGWMGENDFRPVPTAMYGVVLLSAAIAYFILQNVIVRAQEDPSALRAAFGADYKGKLSPAFYASAIPLAFVNRWISIAIYTGVAVMWFVPDRRVEPLVTEDASAS